MWGWTRQIAACSASPTQVLRSFTPPAKGKGERLQGTPREIAETLVSRLHEKHLI